MNRPKPWARRWRGTATLGALFAVIASLAAGAAEENRIEQGSTVTLEYTLFLKDGSTASTNVGKEPLVYTQGDSKLLPALETELLGLKVDDTKTVRLTPRQAYGTVDPAAFVNVPPDNVPEDARTVGAKLVAVDQEGNRVRFRVHEVHADRIVLDMNHPLAGETVTFEVRVISVD